MAELLKQSSRTASSRRQRCLSGSPKFAISSRLLMWRSAGPHAWLVLSDCFGRGGESGAGAETRQIPYQRDEPKFRQRLVGGSAEFRTSASPQAAKIKWHNLIGSLFSIDRPMESEG